MNRVPRLVVGIASSSAGIGALRQFLEAYSVGGGIAFVILASDSDADGVASQLMDIALPVLDAIPGKLLEADTVYVGGGPDSLGVRDGRIEATEVRETLIARLPVDYLFHSLVREFGQRSVGIVLSGAAPDGMGGLREIRAAGGLTIARTPGTRQATLARRAIDAGEIDLVLGVSDMPAALARFQDLPGRRGDPTAEERASAAASRKRVSGSIAELGAEGIQRLASLLGPQIDVDLRVYKRTMVERRLTRRMLLSGHEDTADYLGYLAGNADERRTLGRDLLIGVTDFFRDPQSFEALRESVIDPIVGMAPSGSTIRAWVPGCATGEEAYSIAMEFLAAIEQQERKLLMQIFGTDIDHNALAVARSGKYPASVLERIPRQYVDRYFQRQNGSFRVTPELREVVSFAVHDLTRDAPFSRMHLVSCRNLLIYLRGDVQKQILRRFHFALRPDGYLFLSRSESTGSQGRLFEGVSNPWRVYRKVGVASPLGIVPARRGRSGARPAQPSAGVSDMQQQPSTRPLATDLARRAVLNARVPPSIIVARDGSILFMHGELRPYLRFPEGESPSLELASMVTAKLAARTRSALHRSRSDGETVVLYSPSDSTGRRVRITASPAPDVADDAVILTFEDMTEPATPPTAAGTSGTLPNPAIHRLEQELEAIRGDLRNTEEQLESSHTELRTSNEESLSVNEELQSANEELEATTEELRSLNEELTTVNAQLREKVSQLEVAHDDLSNFFSSAKVATVFLDEQLAVKRYTPAAAELLGIGASDVGRPVGGIARDLLRNGLEQEARAVLEHLTMQSRELHVGDRWVTRQVLPYRTEARRIEGVVVTFMDVTALKAATERLTMRERQQAVIARTGLYALRGTNLQAFMDHVVREIQQTLQTDFCKILELQPGGAKLLLRAGVGWREGIVGTQFVPTGPDSQAGFTLQSADPIIVEDLSTEKRFNGPALLIEHGVVSGLSCIIRDGDHVYGVLGAHTDRLREFTPEDANFLQAIASVIGSAVGRFRNRLRLAIERGVAKALSEATTPDQAFTDVLACFAREFPVSVGEIWWPTSDRQRLTRRLFYVEPPSARNRFDNAFGVCEFESGEQLVGRVFETGTAVWCTDVAEPDVFMRREVAAGLGLVAGFGFPIRAGRDVLGVVAIFSQSRLSADESLLNTLEALGRSMGEFLARWEIESRARRLAAITSSSHDGILSYNFDMEVTEWLAGAEQLFGYTADEMIGTSIERIVPEDRRAELYTINARILNGEVIDPYDTVRLRKDGTALDISVRSALVRDSEGKMVGISSTDRDITRQKEAERRLVAADRQKDEFLAMLGHELRNPLATIRSAAELLKLSPDNPDRLRRTQSILERQSAHMAKLLDGLLDVSRIIRGTIHLDMMTIDFATICRDVCSDVIERIPERDLEIRVDMPIAPVWLEADPVRLAQVVDNLLSNAVKYTPDGGSIIVTLSRANGSALLSVRDTGVGIPADLIPDIFEVFRQAQQNLDRSYGGLGLGLALVKSLVTLHNGTVEARSEGPNRGAEFVVRLPTMRSSSVLVDTDSALSVGPLSVLLIEDNAESAELLQEVLGLSGHTVTLASRAREGIEMAGKLLPDLVLCDLGLPEGMTGFDVARALRSNPSTRHLRLVALSGYGRPEDKDRCLEAGFDAHLTKPVDVKTIGRIVADLVAKHGSR